MDTLIPDDLIQSKIYEIRGHRVMLDKDLAILYHVTTGNLNKAVHRNKARFPDDFMFQLTQTEFENLIFQIGTSSWGGTRKLPYAFTEEGVAMLSGVLKSMQAVQVHVQIIRIFARVRKMTQAHAELLLRLDELERQAGMHDADIQRIFEALKQLLYQPNPPRPPIGFKH